MRCSREHNPWNTLSAGFGDLTILMSVTKMNDGICWCHLYWRSARMDFTFHWTTSFLNFCRYYLTRLDVCSNRGSLVLLYVTPTYMSKLWVCYWWKSIWWLCVAEDFGISMEETSAPCGKYVINMPHHHYNRNGAWSHIILPIDLRYAKSLVCWLIFANPLLVVFYLSFDL